APRRSHSDPRRARCGFPVSLSPDNGAVDIALRCVAMTGQAAAAVVARRAGMGTAESSSLELTLRALSPVLADPDVTDLCINSPREAFIETRRGWERRPLPFADFGWCQRLAKLVANATRQRIDES